LIIGIFRSRLREDARRYPATAKRMEALVARQPGFLGIKSFQAGDGERVSLFSFESLAAAEAWRDHPEHREAQRLGRNEFYASYSIQLCEPIHEARFEMPGHGSRAGAREGGRG
jgi:heme-degrading monooxygenase HmoA